MSEYQRYEFMTCDRPLTSAQLDAVNDLSSHIEASSTHALIEYKRMERSAFRRFLPRLAS